MMGFKAAVSKELCKEFNEVMFKGQQDSQVNFVCDGIQVRAKVGYSSTLEQYWATIEQFNQGWREITTVHFI